MKHCIQLAIGCLLIVAAALCFQNIAPDVFGPVTPAKLLALLGLSLAPPVLGMTFEMRDASVKVSVDLPDGYASAEFSDGIDLGVSSRGDYLDENEFVVTAPALTTAELPDDETMTYVLQQDDNAAFTSPTTLFDNVIVQTGAGGAGAVAATKRLRLPVDVERYIRLKVSNSGEGNASAKSATLEGVF